MSNPLLDQVMGRRVQEDVPVPVAALPRRAYRDRMAKDRQRPELGRPEEPEREEESLDNVRSVIGEAEDRDVRPDEEGVIPKDAEEVDDAGSNVITAKMRPIKDVVQEPSHPSGEKEKFLTPYAALTAPDATPDAMSPIDPSKVPGMATQSKFTWSELEKAPPQPVEEPPAAPVGGDSAVNTMDILLGRNRGATPVRNAEEMPAAGAIATEEQAMAALGIENPMITEAAKAKAAAALVANPDPTGGSLMPEHKPADSKKVYEAARRWM